MWEQGKDYVMVGNVVVEENLVLTIEPDVRIFVKADTEEDYCGLIVKGRLLADGGDALHAIRFAPVRWSVQGDVNLRKKSKVKSEKEKGKRKKEKVES